MNLGSPFCIFSIVQASARLSVSPEEARSQTKPGPRPDPKQGRRHVKGAAECPWSLQQPPAAAQRPVGAWVFCLFGVRKGVWM